MKTRILFFAAALLLASAVVSCSDDDATATPSDQAIDPDKSVPDPAGTITLNMRNEDNGKTYLGDIYIDNANNFVSRYNTQFVDLGAMRGLGNITTWVVTGLTSKCAVVPGHGYCAYYDNSEGEGHTFPSGKTTILSAGAHKMYVDSWILSGAATILGAVVKYVATTPYGLPSYASTIGSVAPVRGESVSIDLSDEVASFADTDVEIEVESGAFSVSRNGKTLTFTQMESIDEDGYYTEYLGRMWIRVKDFCTYVCISMRR